MAKTRIGKSGKREQLLDEVVFGRMTREEAEAIAARQGLPLQTTPRKEDHNPMREATWSLTMAVAWIVWRSPDAVRSAWTDFRSKYQRWRWHRDRSGFRVDLGSLDADEFLTPATVSETEPPDSNLLGSDPSILDISGLDEDLDDVDWDSISTPSPIREIPSHGWDLEALKPASLSDLEAEWQSGEWPSLKHRYMEIETARRELWAKLSATDLIASAIHVGSGEIGEIPAKEWPHLEYLGLNADEQEVLGFPGGGERYQNVQLARPDVVKCWPIFSGQTHLGQQHEIEDEKEVELEKVPRKRNRSQEEVERTCGIIRLLISKGIINPDTVRPHEVDDAVKDYIPNNITTIGKGVPSSTTIRKARRSVIGR